MKKILTILALGLYSLAAEAQTQTSPNYPQQPQVFTHFQNPSNVFTQGAITGHVYENVFEYRETPIISQAAISGADNPAVVLYPSPARSYTNIVLADVAADQVYVDIYDLNGTLWQENTFAPGAAEFGLDVSNLPRGLYSIQVQERGKSLQSVRLQKVD